jgi:hypothetical protein
VRFRRVVSSFTSIAVAAAVCGLGLAGGPLPAASAATTPNGTEYHRMVFPVRGAVHYGDDFGDCRSGCSRRHEGNDLMGAKLMPLVAAAAGRVTFVRGDASGSSGNMLMIEGTDGWEYWYLHVNNDTPGTDDGANPAQWRFGPGIREGVRVKAGQLVGYMGDSGNAEGSGAHVHFELHGPDGEPINPYTSLRLAQNKDANGQCAFPSNPRRQPRGRSGPGYWIVERNGTVRTFGNAQTYGANVRAAGQVTWSRPVVGLAPAPNGSGYWLTDTAGRVVPFGDARGFGSTEYLALEAPIIGMTPTANGKGYWLLAKDGGIFSYGNARFYGSMGARRLAAPIVGMAATPTGKGYWLLGRDGGIFSFGDAHFYGSTGNLKLDRPVLSMAATANGKGYWLLAQDGGMFTFGDAAYRGSLPGYGLCEQRTAVAMASTLTGRGYWVLEANGRVNAFGDAKSYGSALGTKVRTIAAVPA